MVMNIPSIVKSNVEGTFGDRALTGKVGTATLVENDGPETIVGVVPDLIVVGPENSDTM